MTIKYRVAHSTDDLQRVVDLEITVWGIHERDAFPVHMLRLAQLHGGAIIVAERDGDIIGLNIGYPARRNGEWVLWSYITGVHPSMQRSNIGCELKQQQRRWAQENNYAALCWTFDPLQAKNANFNLNRLQATAYKYHPNLYGQMADAINKLDLPSDRLEVRWPSTPSSKTQSNISSEDVHFLIDADGNYQAKALETDMPIGICLPGATDDKRRWQQQLRTAFEQAFDRNYRGVDFKRATTHPYYVLTPSVSG